MKFMIEGVDGCGKSTFVERIKQLFPNTNFKVIHCTRTTLNTFPYFFKMIMSDEDLIIDRGYLGQFVYQTEEEREANGWLNYADLRTLDVLASSKGIIKIYLTANTDLCLYNCKHNGEDGHYTSEYIDELKSKYDKLISTELTNWIYYDNSFTHPEFSKSFDYSSLPKIVAVDFDGTLNLTDKPFPSIGEPFIPLLHELTKGKYKDYKKVLYTCRSGKALDDAIAKCKEWGLNLDAVNDNIDELKQHGLNPRKIYCDLIIDDIAVHPMEFVVRP